MAHPVNTFFKKMKKVVKPPSLFALFDFHKFSTEKREALKSVCAKLGIKIMFIYAAQLRRRNLKILLGDALFNERAKIPVHQYLRGISCYSRGPRGIVVKA